MNKSVFLEDMDAFGYREILASGEAIVLIPVGSLEQHGPHLPPWNPSCRPVSPRGL